MTHRDQAKDESDPGPIPEPPDSVSALMRPRGIAVVGASAKDFTLGQRLLTSLATGGYKGVIYPVNPRYETVQDLPCYASVKDVPGPLDCVAYAINEHRLTEALAEAAGAGARGAVVFSRGYVPPNSPRPTVGEQWAGVARELGMAVLGDNCMGMMNFVDNLRITGNPPKTPPGHGTVGLLSHSGSTWSGLVGNQRQLTYNFALSIGRESVTGLPQYMNFLLNQEETRAIGLVLEGVRDAEGFRAALDRAEAQDVPVVALKLGRSEKGQRFALSHSGAVSGSDSSFQAVCEHHAVSRVHTLDEFTDTLEIMRCTRRPTTDAIGVGTDSGGERELISDIGTDLGIRFAEFSPETTKKLEDTLDPGLSPLNPVDYWGDGRLYWEDCLKVMADDPGVGLVMMATNMVPGRKILTIAGENIENVHKYSPKPAVMMGNIHSTIDRGEAERLRGIGIPVLMGTQTALTAVKHFMAYHHRRRTDDTVAMPDDIDPIVVSRWKKTLESNPGRALDSHTAMALLADFGCPVVAGRSAHGEEEALRAADEIGYPVVVKTAAPDILHKSDRGGVIMNVGDAEALVRATRRLADAFGPAVQIQAQAPPGVEILLGMVKDAQFGPMMTFGLGGVLVEIFEDVATVIPPIGAERAGACLARLKGFPLLRGARGKPPVDIDALTAVISRFSILAGALGPWLAEIDVNPLIVHAKGTVAVDALVVPAAASDSPNDEDQET